MNSSCFPGRYEQRGHEVSQFWLKAVHGIHVFPGADYIAISSASQYFGPEERRARQLSRQRRWALQRVADLLGRLGTRVPKRVWTVPERLAGTCLRGCAWLNRARDRHRALQAYRKVASDASVLTLDTLREVRILADHLDEVPALILYFACILNALFPYLKDHKGQRVLEIGPAEGVLAIALYQVFGCRLVLIDLPEVLPMAFTMISHYAPEASIVLPHETTAGPIQPEADFVLLVPEQARLIPDCSIDMAINTSSFQEMTYPIIDQYFRLIERCLRPGGLFYCLNETRFQRHADGQVIEFARFPWSSRFRDIFWEDFEYWREFRGYERQHRLQIKMMTEEVSSNRLESEMAPGRASAR